MRQIIQLGFKVQGSEVQRLGIIQLGTWNVEPGTLFGNGRNNTQIDSHGPLVCREHGLDIQHLETPP